VLVKYDVGGVAQWARAATCALPMGSEFLSVAVGPSDEIVASGYIGQNAPFGFGNGVSVAGSGGGNVLLVKYNSSADAQWARSNTSGSLGAQFSGATVGSNGNIYCVGYLFGEYGFGNGVTVANSSSYSNILLVEYDSAGGAQWGARTVTQTETVGHVGGTGPVYFNAVAIDSSGDLHVTGSLATWASCDFGDGVTANGFGDTGAVLLVKY